jgi:8-oxo-dGTP pyrophosphatase MutT (NUDIX family)
MLAPWRRLSSEVAQDFKLFVLRVERYLSPRTAQPVPAFVLDCADWVNVIGLTPNDEAVMIRQFRFGSGLVTLEIPGGIVDPGESPLEAAHRELLEETGYEAERWTSLGSVSPNPAIQRNRLHCFLAEGCRHVAAQSLDPGEDIRVELHAMSELRRKLAAGEVDHALVAVAFHRLDLLRSGEAFG